MDNRKFTSGNWIYTNNTASDIASGDVINLTNCIAIAVEDIAVGDSGGILVKDIYELAKATPLTISIGDKLYWTGTEINKTSAGNIYAGLAAQDAAESDVVVLVDINASHV